MCTMTKWFAGLEIELQFKRVVFSFRQVKMRFKVNQTLAYGCWQWVINVKLWGYENSTKEDGARQKVVLTQSCACFALFHFPFIFSDASAGRHMKNDLGMSCTCDPELIPRHQVSNQKMDANSQIFKSSRNNSYSTIFPPVRGRQMVGRVCS